jgi:hypothetical protein
MGAKAADGGGVARSKGIVLANRLRDRSPPELSYNEFRFPTTDESMCYLVNSPRNRVQSRCVIVCVVARSV